MGQGNFTVLNRDCQTNQSEGTEAIPFVSVPGVHYKKNTSPTTATKAKTETKPTAATLYIGEYACYSYGGGLMAGMGFHLLPNGRYYDLDKKRGGTYTYNAQNATISFSGGFLSGQVG